MPDARYQKVKHLVEVEDDILAVFTVNLGDSHIENLEIAQSANITKDFVNQIFANFRGNFGHNVEETTTIVGHLKWSVHETDRIRTLIIYEKNQSVVVLIKSNISLSESVDNILGYYYET
ncbi:hypothetical protein BH18THE1_BH18THE1_18670 [soil metagenome]